MTTSKITGYGPTSTVTAIAILAGTCFLLSAVAITGVVFYAGEAHHLQGKLDHYERELAATRCSPWPSPYPRQVGRRPKCRFVIDAEEATRYEMYRRDL